MNIHSLTVATIIVLLSIGFVVSNRMSYQDGLDDQAWKCQMISEGTWPNVDGYFERICKS
jgi:hypothetical protein